MIWRSTQDGDMRIRTFFAWFPVYHENYNYWLVKLKVTEKFRAIWIGDSGHWRIETLEVIK